MAQNIEKNSGETHLPGRLSYSIDEAAYALGLGRTMIYELIAKGQIKSIKVGNRRLIPTSALDAFFAAALEGKAAA